MHVLIGANVSVYVYLRTTLAYIYVYTSVDGCIYTDVYVSISNVYMCIDACV